MKILIVGGNGTIGKRVSDHFKEKDTVIIAGRTSGDVNVDITNIDSIKNMFESLGSIDAIISAAGEARWKAFDDLTEEDFLFGIQSKLMGQVNLVRIGRKYLTPGGSITLTTGILADDPVKMTTSASMINGGIHSFVKALALELDNEIRVNVVAPGVVEDAYEKFKDYFPGYNPIPMKKVINGYVRSVYGSTSGEVIRIYD